MIRLLLCVYCPQPTHAEQARKAKLQGKVRLQVLVNAEGPAARVRMLRGLGLGLDEAAVEAVREWRFSPAHDANKHVVPRWVTIETASNFFEFSNVYRSAATD